MDRTRLRARQLNRERARKGPAGDLVLLQYRGQGQTPLFDSLKTYGANETVNGWGADSATGEDGADRVKPTVADVDGGLAGIADPQSGEGTHFALAGKVYKIEPDQTKRPIKAPFVWTLRGSVTNKVWTP